MKPRPYGLIRVLFQKKRVEAVRDVCMYVPLEKERKKTLQRGHHDHKFIQCDNTTFLCIDIN